MTERALHVLESLPKPLLFAAVLSMVGLVGAADYWIGPDLLLVYLLPVLIAARFGGMRAGILTSLASAVTWYISESLAGTLYTRPVLPEWNVAVRLAVYLAMTYFLVELLAARRRNEELSGLIIHDLRSPVANIMAGLDLLRYKAIEESVDEREKVIDLCLSSGQRMLTLIQSLLDVSRLEARRMPLRVEEVNPKDLVESALGQLSLAASRNGVAIESTVDEDSRCVQADRLLTERMLVNLLTNALKYSPPEGRIVLRVATANEKEVAFSVADDGPGVPAEWTQRVFDRFAQVEGRGSGGSGIGLAFCAMASRVQGGRIWLESEAGNGTTVTFTLPVGPISQKNHSP